VCTVCGWLNLEVEVEVEVKVEVKIEVEVAALISLNLCVQQVLITFFLSFLFYVVRSICFYLYTLSRLFHTKTGFSRRRKFPGGT
jgi:hypothetical protein